MAHRHGIECLNSSGEIVCGQRYRGDVKVGASPIDAEWGMLSGAGGRIYDLVRARELRKLPVADRPSKKLPGMRVKIARLTTQGKRLIGEVGGLRQPGRLPTRKVKIGKVSRKQGLRAGIKRGEPTTTPAQQYPNATIRVKKNAETGEWMAAWYDGTKFNEDKTSYETTKADAIATAKAEAARHGTKLVIPK